MLENAQWITTPDDLGAAAFYLSKNFTLEELPASASLTLSAVGLYTAYLNGERVSDRLFAPGCTSHLRVLAVSYDVRALLRRGENTLRVEVGAGWARSRIAYFSEPEKMPYYPKRAALIGELSLTGADGRTQKIVTDDTFTAEESPIRFTSLYDGETVDYTCPLPTLGQAQVTEVDRRICADEGEPVRACEELHAARLIVTPKGERVIDFGQNMTGYVRIRTSLPFGTRIVIRHAEVLDREGNFYDANMRSAKNEMTYITDGKARVLRPTYTFQGFRYILLADYPDAVDLSDFTAVAVHSDMRRTGRFRCGHPEVDQLYRNTVWGQLSNYLDIPTDCPQRDERLGWTGDAQVFARTAAINFDVERFFDKWLADMMLEQRADGAVERLVPNLLGDWESPAGWSDACTVIPMELYRAYGDTERLRARLPMMKKWVGYLRTRGPEEYLWLGDTHYGDWLAMDADEDSYSGRTPTSFIASVYYYYSASLTASACRACAEDPTEYEKIAENVKSTFQKYYMKDGMPYLRDDKDPERTVEMTQTALVLVLHFGMCKGEERPAIAARLAQMIRERGDRMTTGFLGTPYILHALTETGYSDLAYTLLLQNKNPSWLYGVEHGATTIWEHWNGMKEDGSFWSTDMNSFNHYAYGCVFDWVYGAALGITPAAPGYAALTLAPHPDPRLGFAEGSIDTRHGTVRSAWYYRDGDVHFEFTVPLGVPAEITLPSGKTYRVCGGRHFFTEPA